MLFRFNNELVELNRTDFMNDKEYYTFIMKQNNIHFITKSNNIEKKILKIIHK